MTRTGNGCGPRNVSRRSGMLSRIQPLDRNQCFVCSRRLIWDLSGRISGELKSSRSRFLYSLQPQRGRGNQLLILFWITLAPSIDDVARSGAQLCEARWQPGGTDYVFELPNGPTVQTFSLKDMMICSTFLMYGALHPKFPFFII